MAKERLGAGERKNVTPSEEQSVMRWRNVASAAGGKASWTPPPLCSCLLTSKEEGKKQESHDWEGLGFIPKQPTQDRERSAERLTRERVAAPLLCRFI